MPNARPYWSTGDRKAGLAAQANERDTIGVSPFQHVGGGDQRWEEGTSSKNSFSGTLHGVCASRAYGVSAALSATSDMGTVFVFIETSRLRETEVEEAGFKPSCGLVGC